MKYAVLILIISFFILYPVFAESNSTITNQLDQKIMIEQINKTNTLLQKINENLNQTNSNIIDLKKSEESNFIITTQFDTAKFQFDNYRFMLELLSTFVVALFGVSMGLVGNRIRDNQIEKGKIKKIKNLLSDDISRIYNNVNISLLDIERLLSILHTTNNMEVKILEMNGIAKSISQILVNIRLLHWDAIVHSGYLIKLDTGEIRSLQNLQNYLYDTRNQMLEFYKLKIDQITLISASQDSMEDKISNIKIQLKHLAVYFHFIYPNASSKLMQVQNEIEWLSDKFDSRTLSNKINDWFKKDK